MEDIQKTFVLVWLALESMLKLSHTCEHTHTLELELDTYFDFVHIVYCMREINRLTLRRRLHCFCQHGTSMAQQRRRTSPGGRRRIEWHGRWLRNTLGVMWRAGWLHTRGIAMQRRSGVMDSSQAYWCTAVGTLPR